MRILLLFAVVYSVWAANQPPSRMKLQTDNDSSEFSGNFPSVYLASSDAEMTKENRFLRIYTRNIRYYLNRNNSKEFSVSFYRREDNCENHTVVAEYIGNLILDKQGVYPVFQDDCGQQILQYIQLGNFNDLFYSYHQILERSSIKKRNSFCLTPSGNTTESQRKENGECTGSNLFWALNTRFYTIPYFWIYSPDLGKRATSSTLDNDSKQEYFKGTNLYNIPSENIRDMTQTDSCPS